MPASNSDFVRQLAAFATPKVEPIMVVAKDDNEVLDQACQSAVAYWMLGWHEDEIASVLEDEGFPDEIVEKAMEHLEEHAEELIEAGPFALYEFGQIVKMTNGEIGTLKDKNQHCIVLQMGDDLIQIAPDQIDMQATASLTKAFQLRQEAQRQLHLIADDEKNLPASPDDTKTYLEIYPEEPEHKFPSKHPFFGKGPTGEPVKLVEVESVREALNTKIESLLFHILDVQEHLNKTQADLKDLQEEYKQRIAPLQQAQSEELRTLKAEVDKVFTAITQLEGISEAEYARAYELQGRFVILQQIVEHGKPAAETITTAEEYKQFYMKMHEFADQSGAFFQKLRKNMDRIEKECIKIKKPFFERLFGIFFPTKERRGAYIAQDQSWFSRLWDSFTEWVDSIWNSMEEIYASWTNDLEPEAEEQMQMADELIAEYTALSERADAQVATENVINAGKRRR